MYKEQNKIGQVRCLISMNESMKSIFAQYDIAYKSLQATTLSLRLSEYIKCGIEKRKYVNCYTYKNLEDFEVFYSDSVGNEYSNNKVFVDGDVSKALCMGLKFAFAIAGVLADISDNFNVVLSYDGTDVIVSFYCKRDHEEWLVNNLDSYTEEAIFVISI